MATYAIGDIQGCHEELVQLLDQLGFDAACDRLILVGDLVNRGPRSLEVLRLVHGLGAAAEVVLGNHDLHLLAVAHGGRSGRRDTLDAVLAAPDRDDLLDWLARRPLALFDAASGILFVHAGLPPQWTLEQTLDLAAEAAVVIGGGQRRDFLLRMYGDNPDSWSPTLRGINRTRLIVNCLTRLRYCTAAGRCDLKPKGAPGTQAADLMPWFDVPDRRTRGTPIVFGHWSTLGQIAWPEAQVHGLDSGCVWGGKLSALNLDTGAITQRACAGHHSPGEPAD